MSVVLVRLKFKVGDVSKTNLGYLASMRCNPLLSCPTVTSNTELVEDVCAERFQPSKKSAPGFDVFANSRLDIRFDDP